MCRPRESYDRFSGVVLTLDPKGDGLAAGLALGVDGGARVAAGIVAGDPLQDQAVSAEDHPAGHVLSQHHPL